MNNSNLRLHRTLTLLSAKGKNKEQERKVKT